MKWLKNAPGRLDIDQDEPIHIVGYQPQMQALGTRRKTSVEHTDGSTDVLFDEPFSLLTSGSFACACAKLPSYRPRVITPRNSKQAIGKISLGNGVTQASSGRARTIGVVSDLNGCATETSTRHRIVRVQRRRPAPTSSLEDVESRELGATVVRLNVVDVGLLEPRIVDAEADLRCHVPEQRGVHELRVVEDPGLQRVARKVLSVRRAQVRVVEREPNAAVVDRRVVLQADDERLPSDGFWLTSGQSDHALIDRSVVDDRSTAHWRRRSRQRNTTRQSGVQIADAPAGYKRAGQCQRVAAIFGCRGDDRQEGVDREAVGGELLRSMRHGSKLWQLHATDDA
jgi:hypothetical protein